MYLLILSYKQPLSEVDRFVPEHRQFLERHYDSGHFQLSGRREPRTGGVILVRAASRDEVLAIVQQDPFHREQLADYELIEFLPSMAAAGLDGLREL